MIDRDRDAALRWPALPAAILIAAIHLFILAGPAQSAAASTGSDARGTKYPRSSVTSGQGASGAGTGSLEAFPVKRPRRVAVEKYAVRLELFPEKHMVSGEVDIYPPPGELFSGEITLKLHQDMDVRSLETLSGGALRPAKYSRFHDDVTFTCAEPSEKISASFYGDPSRYITHKNSFTYIGEEGCYFDDLCAYFPRAGFEQRSSFELSVTHRGSWTPVTQGEAAGSETLADGRVTTRFVNARKSRCHTLAAGPYEKSSSITRGACEVNAFFYAHDAARVPAHLSEAVAALDFYRSRYGDNGIKKLNIVEVEKVFPGGYGPEEVIYLTASAVSEKTVDQELIAHEIAHQWFGNFVMGEFPESNFLNEAFATYASLEYIREKHPEEFRAKFDELARHYLAYRSHAGTAEISINEAARNPVDGRAWQVLLYYRGMMALRATLRLLSKASGMKPAEIIAAYLSNFAEKTVTIDEFRKFVLDGGSALYSRAPARDEKAFREAAAAFDLFYFGTAAVELAVKSAVVEGTDGGGRRARVVLERSDSLEIDFEASAAVYGAPEKSPESGAVRIAKKSLFLRRGENIVEFDLDAGYLNHSYVIDEENDNLISYRSPAFVKPEPATESVAVCASPAGVPEKFGEFCRELAANAGYRTVSDRQFDAAGFFKYRDILLIGNFKESPLARFIGGAFNFSGSGSRVDIVNCFNHGRFDLVEGVCARLVMKNPFLEGGVVTAALFSGSEALGGYNRLRLSGGDYCVYDAVTRKYKTGSFNYGLSGEFAVDGGIKLLYAGLGVCGNVITGLPAPLTLLIYNSRDSTVEAVLSADDPLQCFIPENITLAPKTFTRHETFPATLKSDVFNFTLTGRGGLFQVRDRAGAATYFGGIDAILVGAGGGGEDFQRINVAINHLYTGQFRGRSPANAIMVNFSSAPLDPLAYEGFKAIILNNYDIAAAPDGFTRTLMDFARKGGSVIVSGGGMSEIYSPETASFMAEIFGVSVSSSVVHSFDETAPGLFLTLRPDGMYGFAPLEWSLTVTPYRMPAQKARTPKAPAVIRCRGDNPEFISSRSGGFFYDGHPKQARGTARLIRRALGRGAFYYLPYDFSDEAVKNSPENIRALKNAFSSPSATAVSQLRDESPDHLMFDPAERPWPFKIEYYLAFMLLYFSAYAAVYRYASRRRSGAGYIFLSCAAAAACFLFLTAVFLRYSVFQTPPEMIGVIEMVDGYRGPVYEQSFHKIWSPDAAPLSLELEGRLIPWNDHSRGFNKASFGLQGKKVMLDAPSPLIFYPVIFSTIGQRLPASPCPHISFKAFRPAGKDHFTVRFDRSPLEMLSLSGRAVLLVKTPGGCFTREASRAAGEYVFGGAAASVEQAMKEISEKLQISSACAGGLKNVITAIESSAHAGAEPHAFLLNASDETLNHADGRVAGYRKLSVAAAGLELVDEKGTLIPDYFFKKEPGKLDNETYHFISFSSPRFKEFAAASAATAESSLYARVKLKLLPSATAPDIKRFVDSFAKSFAKNLRHSSNIAGDAMLRFTIPATPGYDIKNILHDNRKNFVYNINEGHLTIEIANFGHYLNYDLNSIEDGLGFFLRQASLGSPCDREAGFEISVGCK